jgi:hypothetical protein
VQGAKSYDHDKAWHSVDHFNTLCTFVFRTYSIQLHSDSLMKFTAIERLTFVFF